MNAKNAALGERIRQARKTLGLTQQEFAAQLAVTQPTVHRWEKGFYDPDEDALQRLAGMTKLSPAYFRYGEGGALTRAMSAAVTGYIDGDGEIHPLDDRGEPTVDAPPSDKHLSAVEIRGNGLHPAYSDDDLVFYATDNSLTEAAFLEHDCVVRLAGNVTLLKRVARGTQRDRYTLTGPNATPIKDARLEWASPVLWIRRR